jgi:hypothetical protein
MGFGFVKMLQSLSKLGDQHEFLIHTNIYLELFQSADVVITYTIGIFLATI